MVSDLATLIGMGHQLTIGPMVILNFRRAALP